MSYLSSVRAKLVTGFSIIAVIMLCVGILNYLKIQEIIGLSKETELTSLKLTLHAKDAQINIIQVQQWLTDISATRGQPGFDDGFQEAKKNADEFLNHINELRIYYETTKNAEYQQLITDLLISFDAFYKMGQDMAKVYVESGPEKGNLMMEKFDPFAEALTSNMNKLVSYQTQGLAKNTHEITLLSEDTIQSFSFSFLLIGLSLLFIIFRILSPFLHRLNTLNEGLNNVATGEGDLRLRIQVQKNDEVSQVSKIFNLFIANLHKTMSNIKNTLSVFQSSSKQQLECFEEINEDITLMNSQSEVIASSTLQSSTSLKVVSNNTAEISNSLIHMKTDFQDLLNSVTQIKRASEEENNIVNQAFKESNSANIEISKLLESAREIEKIKDVIKEIVDQTHLLALNATIEAASAGDAGKGFAVVANEVKALAKQTTEATAEIEFQINSMRDKTQNSVGSIETIHGIIDSINKLSNSNLEAIEIQTQNIESINTNMENVSKSTESLALNINESSLGLDQIAENVHKLNQTIEHVTENATRIQQINQNVEAQSNELSLELNHFKTDQINIG